MNFNQAVNKNLGEFSLRKYFFPTNEIISADFNNWVAKFVARTNLSISFHNELYQWRSEIEILGELRGGVSMNFSPF